MRVQKRGANRIHFANGYPAKIIGIDGTWCREVFIDDISQTGARVDVIGSVAGLPLKEFFLALGGAAHRRCEMKWLSGESMGLRFIFPKARREP